nr:hypothetical protein [Paracoccus saliphilus]
MRFDDLAQINPPTRLEKGTSARFVEMSSLPNYGRDITTFDTKPYTGSGSRFVNGDTLIARITPCFENGKGAMVSGLPDKNPAFGSTEFIVARPKVESDARFVYYLTRTEDFRSVAISRMEGTSGRQRVAWQQIASIEIPDISSGEREEVGAILGALDDKIELNRKTAATLEEMARALYRSWFVDFDPVHAKAEGRAPAHMDAATAALFPESFGEDGLPVGWTNGRLMDVVVFNPRETITKGKLVPYLDMKALPTSGLTTELPILREFASGTKFRDRDTLLARISPCLENGKTGIASGLGPGVVGWGSTEFIVMRAKDGVPFSLPYCVARDAAFREEAIATMTGSSGRQRADEKRIAEMPFALPADDIWQAFSEITIPMMEAVESKGRESQTLTTLRDTLLPRLMSGELRVGAAKELIEEVA